MPSWLTHIVSAVLAVMLAGAPAALAACLSLCMPEAVESTHAASASPASHEHHGSAAVESPAATSAHGCAPAPSSMDQLLSPVAHDCCPDDRWAPAESVTATRGDAPILIATVAASLASMFAPLPERTAPSDATPVVFPLPTRAPLVLRI